MVTAALVSDTLSAIGAIGGLLSIVGVGLLILLVASQSRQIRAMREWIEQEPQRQQETAQRVIAEVQRRIAAARERRATPGAPPAVPGVPGAAAGVKPAPGTLGATPEAQAVAAKQAGTATTDAPTEVQTPGAPAFAPLTPAAGAGNGSDAPTSVPPPGDPLSEEPAIVSEILSQETQAADALGDDVLQPAIPSARSRDQRFGEEQFDLEDEEPRSNRLLFGIGAVALLAGIVLIGTQLFGGGDGPSESASSGNVAGDTDEATPRPRATPVSVDPASVTVRVYNGTRINGLACRAVNALKAKDYGVGDPLTRGSNEVLNATIVMYRPNFKTAATQVAKDLGVATTGVQPIDEITSADAGETAEVVVITGADFDDGSTGCSTSG